MATTCPDFAAPAIQTPAETEFRRGWPAVLTCFCVAIFAWGFGFYGQAVFVGELHATRGWPVSLIAGAATLCYFSSASLIPFVHAAVDRAGPRVLMIGGALLWASERPPSAVPPTPGSCSPPD